MFRRENINPDQKRWAAGGVLLATILALGSVYAASSQEPAAAPATAANGAQRPRRGGGFTHPEPVNFAEHEGWTSLWDGKTLNGWSGDKNWRADGGAIVIEPTCEKPTGTVYLVWQGGELSDFELKMEMKGEGNINGGVQYRSWIVPPREAPAGGGMRNRGPCPSGAAPGTPPTPASEAQWNMAGAQYDFDAGN